MLLWAGLLMPVVHAATIQNTVTGTFNGNALDLTQATVTMNVGGGLAITDAIAEINPAGAAISASTQYRFDFLPNIQTGDTGVDRITLNLPAGFIAPTVDAITVAGTTLTSSCPTTLATHYCATIVGNQIQIDLGNKITIDQTQVGITFTATNASTPGVHNMTATVDDSTTLAVAQALVAGDANADASDSNNLSINLQGQAVTSVLAEISPNNVAVAGANASLPVLTLDVLPTIGAQDSGFDQVAIQLPANYNAQTVTGVSVSGTSFSSDCVTTASGEFCAQLSGQQIIINLGAAITVDQQHVQVSFQATAPAVPGSANVVVSVDDTNTNAVAAQLAVVGDADADAGDNNSLTLQVEGHAATQVLAEISPNFVAANAQARVFAYDMLATIGANDTGIDRVTLSVPAGYSNLTLNWLAVANVAWSQICPALGNNEFCASSDGTQITIDLGNKITVDQTRISAEIQVDAPAAPGTTIFISQVDDLATTSVDSMDSIDGDADGDASDNNSRAVTVVTNADPSLSTVVVEPDIVIANGVDTSNVTVTLLDVNSQPVATKVVSLSTDRGALDLITQSVGLTQADGVAVGSISSNRLGVATVTATDVSDGFDLVSQPVIYFTQGEVLQIAKRANKQDAVIGDVVTYMIEIRNTTDKLVEQINLIDRIPPNFKYRVGSARLNGAPMNDPSGVRNLTFDVGDLDALADSNNNGQADVGESGYTTVSYQLIIGSGAKPGDYVNTARAVDVCDRCYISNETDAKIEVVLDPLFDLGTIIGKVFDDRDGDGKQSEGEAGIGGAMVVLDNGSYVLTDEYGRYHFPAVVPGHRLLKINLKHLAENAMATTEVSRVVSVTEGLLAKANFGVSYEMETNTIGRPAVMGMNLDGESRQKPIQVQGNVVAMLTVINGALNTTPNADVHLGSHSVADIVEIRGGKLTTPAIFSPQVDANDKVHSWRFVIEEADGMRVRTLQGDGAVPEAIEWNGRDETGALVKGGNIFQYQLLVDYLDNSHARTARQLFGVNRAEVLSVNMSGGAFKTGSFDLSDGAKKILAESAQVLKQFPQEQVVVEGHSDSMGPEAINMQLSQRRAEEAARYLIEGQGVPREQVIVQWFGESLPMVSNDTELGREINRRVEVKGNFNAQAEAKLFDQYQVEPQVKVNGELLPLDGRGGFRRSFEAEDVDQFELSMINSRGSELHAVIDVPELKLTSLQGSEQFSYPSSGDGFEVYAPSDGTAWKTGDEVLLYELRGLTDAGNRIEIDGVDVPVAANGSFAYTLTLQLGKNHIAVMATNPQGYSRIADLHAEVNDRDEDGKLMMLVTPIPDMTVKLPQVGAVRTIPELPISGVTDPANIVSVNGERVDVNPEGQFTANLVLPKGRNVVQVVVTDPQGFSGMIEREIEITDDRLFFLAFADGKFGQLKGSGYLEGAGMQESSEFYNEGRVAYYLKGVIKGKYLITSAFDSGTGEIGKLFDGLDETDTSKLFSNLDPDKLYPVYGDSSTLVHDTESQSKFYLALESDEINAIVGNYSVGFNDTELASYQRTLYGVRASYESLAKTMGGRNDTQVIVFAADVKQAPVHDELRATGGALYYLSHADIIEGSEQVSLVVRDKDTGLTLSRTTLQQNIDYRIYYDQGRLITTDPIASTVEDQSLFDNNLLSGHPVTLVVDYETELSSFDKKAYGTRLSKTLTKNIAVGVTQINDDLDQGEYQLSGVDAEMRIGRAVRVLGEIAQSNGVASHTYFSEDGGLSFNDITPSGQLSGQAWKAAMELDVGELLGDPGRMFVDAYLKRLSNGFLSSGNFLEKGTRKAGLNMLYNLSSQSSLMSRYTIEESDYDPANSSAITETTNLSLQWRYDANRWGVSTEYQSRDATDASGNEVDSSSYASGQVRYQVTEKLAARLERQQTLEGTENDQTTLGADYQLSESTKVTGSVAEGTKGQAAKAGIQWLFDGGKLYLDERAQQDNAGQSSLSTVIGGENRLGSNSRIYSEYQIENADAGDKQVSLVGTDRFWDLRKGMQFKLALEQSVINGDATDSERYTVATVLSYKDLSGLSWSTKNEVRRERGDKERLQYLSNNFFEMKLSPDYTLLLKYVMSETRDLKLDAIEAKFNEHSIGLAYRPVATDRFNLLARYTGISEKRPLNLGLLNSQETAMDVFSIEWSYELTNALEWVDKLAFRTKTEETGGFAPFTSHTWLSIHRLNYQFAKAWDVGAEYRSLVQREANDQRDGWLTEVMWRANRHVRLGVGFNFTDFSDNEFSDNDYSVYGWFLRLQGKY